MRIPIKHVCALLGLWLLMPLMATSQETAETVDIAIKQQRGLAN